MASGLKNEPVRPVRKKIGSSASASMSDAYTTAPRTSSDASKTTLAVVAMERSSLDRRCRRSRRTMFSTSTIASSTTAPKAITNPASTIVLIVVPRQARTSPAATSDSGIVTALIKALRRSEDARVDRDPGKPGAQLVQRRLDPLRDLERVAPGELLDDQHEARAVVDDGVAYQRLLRLHDRGHVAEEDRLILVLDDHHLGQLAWRQDRQDVADREPLVRGL